MNKNTQTHSRWWKYAAGTVPFVSLAAIVLLDLLGWADLHNKVLFVILVGFFTSGVIWWWWAIDTIADLTRLLIKTEKDFNELKTEIKSIKQEVKSLD
jgi:Tfp pilus assembly protein PilO